MLWTDNFRLKGNGFVEDSLRITWLGVAGFLYIRSLVLFAASGNWGEGVALCGSQSGLMNLVSIKQL